MLNTDRTGNWLEILQISVFNQDVPKNFISIRLVEAEIWKWPFECLMKPSYKDQLFVKSYLDKFGSHLKRFIEKLLAYQ